MRKLQHAASAAHEILIVAVAIGIALAVAVIVIVIGILKDPFFIVFFITSHCDNYPLCHCATVRVFSLCANKNNQIQGK